VAPALGVVAALGVLAVVAGADEPTSPPPIVGREDGPAPAVPDRHVVWRPQADGPAPLPIDEAAREGEAYFSYACLGGAALVEHRDHGTGHLVAVIGDSITREVARDLVADTGHDWLVVSGCGLGLEAFAPDRIDDDPRVRAALDEVAGARPDVLVLALGTYDLDSTADRRAAALDALLTETADVPCRAVMNTHPSEQLPEHRGLTDVDRMRALNDELDARTGDDDLVMLDWDATVRATALTDDGYHPFLYPSDWLHLVPGQGDVARLGLIDLGLDECALRTSATGPSSPA
jgi:hypothetical protein